jgi:UDP-N-acetylmuramoyl-L-alanyl-D-glutamate--2,6-diaminopimelate ligase
MDEYFNAKKKLFDIAEKSIINTDDEYGAKIGIGSGVSVNDFQDIKFTPAGVSFSYKGEDLYTSLIGKFNLENIRVAVGVCEAAGIPLDIIKKGLENFSGVSGRMEVIENNKDINIVIDYAHTPDGLKNVLETAREIKRGRLVCLFGCGGDRDRTKRPIMGKIASELSDFCIITSDNPRTENPKNIINDILDGVKGNSFTAIENRLDAIRYAIDTAQKDDFIVIAGKGHEDYQEINHEKFHFDEHEIVRDILGET